MTIKEARKLAGLTQQKMGEMLKTPLRTIQDWESEKRTPPIYVKILIIEKLLKIAEENK